MPQLLTNGKSPRSFWRIRFTVVSLCALATFICYMDRVSISIAIIPMATEMSWDAETQGRVLSSFFLGYLLTQVLGGWLADRFGGKAILGYGVILWSLFTFITPPAAALGLTVLILVRIGMGMGEAVCFPSVYSLVGRWMPVSERSRAIGLNNSCVPLGTVFALLVTPIIVENFGWEWAFYLFGFAGLLWWLFWQKLVTAEPETHPRISQIELDEIRAETGGSDNHIDDAPTIRDLLKLRPVWAIIVAHFCTNWSVYVLLSWLPTFVNKGLGVDFASVGILTMLPHICAFFAMNYAGRMADKMISKGMDITKVRKIMQTLASGGLAVAFLFVGSVNSVTAAITIMCIGTAFSAFVTGGFLVNHMDIAPRHAGKLMGLTNTAGTLPGIVGVYISGLILQATGSWSLVFQVTAGITLLGLIFYLAFASGKKIYN